MSQPSSDPVMTHIGAAGELSRAGDVDGARAAFAKLWRAAVAEDDAFHRCVVAHFAADAEPDVEQELAWDLRALEAADEVTDERLAAFHAGLTVASFYPSLLLGLADDYRRVGDDARAREHLARGQEVLGVLGDDPYGETVRGVAERLAALYEAPKVVTAARVIGAPASTVFELIADPARQPAWDGNANLAEAAGGQRVRAVGDVFVMRLTMGEERENHVVAFEEGRLLAWTPSDPGRTPPPGHLWRWELQPLSGDRTAVRHTYDWTGLVDEHRFERARNTTTERLMGSLDRLAAAAET
ncbi:SRPBCC family protein [Actinomycetospora succinea]|uniref:SRPBCC family protein n=1 Tax=Actinomycetospora succinea TaxID=663603 RepID=UPI001FB629F2|nr:SRPBCC family protein [Actinomycetospora succinea]